jgi:hypothetical protein
MECGSINPSPTSTSLCNAHLTEWGRHSDTLRQRNWVFGIIDTDSTVTWTALIHDSLEKEWAGDVIVSTHISFWNSLEYVWIFCNGNFTLPFREMKWEKGRVEGSSYGIVWVTSSPLTMPHTQTVDCMHLQSSSSGMPASFSYHSVFPSLPNHSHWPLDPMVSHILNLKQNNLRCHYIECCLSDSWREKSTKQFTLSLYWMLPKWFMKGKKLKTM